MSGSGKTKVSFPSNPLTKCGIPVAIGDAGILALRRELLNNREKK